MAAATAAHGATHQALSPRLPSFPMHAQHPAPRCPTHGLGPSAVLISTGKVNQQLRSTQRRAVACTCVDRKLRRLYSIQPMCTGTRHGASLGRVGPHHRSPQPSSPAPAAAGLVQHLTTYAHHHAAARLQADLGAAPVSPLVVVADLCIAEGRQCVSPGERHTAARLCPPLLAPHFGQAPRPPLPLPPSLFVLSSAPPCAGGSLRPAAADHGPHDSSFCRGRGGTHRVPGPEADPLRHLAVLLLLLRQDLLDAERFMRGHFRPDVPESGAAVGRAAG